MWPTTFISTLVITLSQPQNYVSFLNRRIWFSIRFFLIASFLIGVLGSFIIHFRQIAPLYQLSPADLLGQAPQLSSSDYWVLPFVYPFALILARLLGTTVDSTIIWLVVRIFNSKLPWTKLWQLSLHITIAADLVHHINVWLYPQSSWNFFTIAYLVLFGVLLYALRDIGMVVIREKNLKRDS